MADENNFCTFSFPEDIGKLPDLTDTAVCVVSLVGKTPLHGTKSKLLSSILDRNDIFNDIHSSGKQSSGYIRGCIDTGKKLVILECSSGYDTDVLARLLHSEDSGEGWDSVLYIQARVLLYALHVSHLIVCFSPGLYLDPTYIRLFRVLEQTRNKLHLGDELSKFGLPKTWCTTGRPTCPRMLFVFNPANKAAMQSHPTFEKQKLELEDVIYRLLKRTKILTTSPNTALFSLPSNDRYVHILSASESRSSKDNLLEMFEMCCTGQPLDKMTSNSSDFFSEIFMCQVNQAHGSGFDYHVGRNPSPSPFHIATLKSWFDVASHLYKLLVGSLTGGQDTPRLSAVFSSLKSSIVVKQRFSETRCHKVMQLAENAYQDSLPEHYTEGVHQEQLAKARHVMMASGRGPALNSYLEKLDKECTNYWKNGHRLCESVSLSGNHCIHPLHRLPDEPITDQNEKLPCFDHSTSVTFTVACNCGRTCKDIGDLFTAKYANYAVYEEMGRCCCNSLDKIPFPVYSAPVVNTGASITAQTSSQLCSPKAKASIIEDEPTDRLASAAVTKLKHEDEELTTMSDHQSYCNSLSQGHHRHEITKTDTSVTEECSETVLEDAVEMTKSGYLGHMLTNTSVRGLLPDYPSWALTCLGTYASYNPSAGLDQPGFLASSNFLLPWEVVIKGIIKDQTWPHIGEPTTHKQRKKMAAKKHVVDTNAKIFIGDGYTCPKGHRFLCSSPDKPIKVTGPSLKDNANKLLTMDMPLYTRCPKNEGCVGQLRHIYICTPEIESLVVSVLPKIQPAPIPCPLFLPSHEGPIKLPANGLWVLRLPHFYVDENGHYPLPADTGSMMSCRLLKGTFNFRNTSDPLL